MYDYIKIASEIQHKLDNNEITYGIAEKANDIAYEHYLEDYEEGVKETLQKGKDAIVFASTKIGSTYVDSANKRGEKVAKMIVKKPGKDASSDVLTKYKENLNKVKAGYKIGEILAINLVLLAVPFTNVPFNAGVAVGLSKSKDPSDAMTRNAIDKIKSFKGKVKDLASKLKGKVITPQDDHEIKKIGVQGLNLAKEISRTPTPAHVKESTSTMTKLDLYLIENSNDEDKIFEALEKYIIDNEYNDKTCDIISNYIESL